MRPTHLFAHDKYLSGSEFAIYGCAWPTGPMWAPTKDAPSDLAFALTGTDNYTSINLTTLVPSTVQDPVVGMINDVIEVSGDSDLFGFNAVAGQTYTISLRGAGATPLVDPFLVLRNNALAVLKTDDDGGDGINSLITFQRPIPAYVIDARAYPGRVSPAPTIDSQKCVR